MIENNLWSVCTLFVSRTTQFDPRTRIEEDRNLVDREFSSLAIGTSGMSLAPQFDFILSSRGKRLRSVMLMECAEIVGGSREEALPLAVAIELLHAATLIQDDIIDGEDKRRGRPSLYRKWSVGEAILVADGLICLAIDMAADFGREVLKAIARAGLELCDGEHLDMNSSLNGTLEKKYFSLVERKSASLFRTAAYCGAFVGGGDPVETKLLVEFGRYYGMAYQINDDVADFTERDGVPRDLRNTNPTLPIIHLFENCTEKTRQTINDVFNLHQTTDQNVKQIHQEMQRTGSLRYSLGVMSKMVDSASSVLNYFEESEPKLCLSHLVQVLCPEEASKQLQDAQ